MWVNGRHICQRWVINGIQNCGELVGAELSQHLLLLLHIVAVFDKSVLLLKLLSLQLMGNLAGAGLQSSHGFLMRDLYSHRVTELMVHA